MEFSKNATRTSGERWNLEKPERSTTYFTAIALYLSAASKREPDANLSWDMHIDEAARYLDIIGGYCRTAQDTKCRLLPLPVGLQICGAEPFDDIPALDHLVTVAHRNLMIPEVITSGAWAKDDLCVLNTLKPFKGRINPLTIQTTGAIIRSRGLDHLTRLLEIAHDLQIATTILCGIGPDSPFPKEILSLEALNSRTSIIRTLPLLSNIRNSTSAAPFLLEEPPPYRRCSELMGLLVFPGGDLYPCGRSYGIEEMRLGSLAAESISIIADRILGDGHLRQLHDCGPYFLFEHCANSIHRGSLRPAYLDTCDFHIHALTDGVLSGAVRPIMMETGARSVRHRRLKELPMIRTDQ